MDRPAWALDMERQIHALQDEVAILRRTQPPEGWEHNGYINVADPRTSVTRNCETGEWSVWTIGASSSAASGKTPALAIEAWRSLRASKGSPR